MRIGEITAKMPIASGGDRKTENFKKGTTAPFETKHEATKRIGLKETQVKRFESLAAHPAIVEQVKAEARENDDLPTRTEALRRIAAAVLEGAAGLSGCVGEFTILDSADPLE